MFIHTVLQKLRLSMDSLRTAFTSLTSTLTTLRTELGGARLTLRAGLALQRAERKEFASGSALHSHEWDFYLGQECIAKLKWDAKVKDTAEMPYFQPSLASSSIVHGVVHNKSWFARGAERVVYQCREVLSGIDSREVLMIVGPKLVAKQSVYEEQVFNPSFHRTFLRTQGEHVCSITWS
jgi:hypothetical protein